ncbi:MAG: ABC transporter ATP-binding protein [Proteobacteria bacterium]|nr:ABC transporter ATP-binding protein [Pseudomonadota bacterium]
MNRPVVLPGPFAPASGAGSQLWRLAHWLVPYRWRIAAAVLLALLAALMAVLIPVVFSRVVVDDILLQAHHDGVPDLGQRWLVQALAAGLEVTPLAAAGGLYLLWVGLRAVCGYAFETLFAGAVLSALADLRGDLFAHVERLPGAFYDRVRVGQVLTRITTDVESLAEMLIGLAEVAGEVVPLTVAASVMLSLDDTLTAALSPVLLAVVFATVLFRHLSGPVYRRMRDTASRLNEDIHENLSGIEAIQLARREGYNARRFGGLNEANRQVESRAIRIETAYYPVVENLSFLAIGLILWLGGAHVAAGTASLGSVVLFLQFTDMLFRPVVLVGFQASTIFRAAAASERIFRLLDWREALAVPAEPTPLPPGLHGRIEFRRLDFRYETGEPVIHDFSLAIEAGETVAIVGPTGSGKTTLMRLLCRFYDVASGRLFIDGVDIMQIDPGELRRRVGVILQDFHLFPGSVLDNITLGNPAVSLEDARRAAAAVQALGFIEALPAGFDTPLGDRGNNLSQGQRQLLAFARVVALDPEILILDEATASIDPATEAAIQAGLAGIMKGRTCIVIAHRLQTIREADRIVVVDRGRLVEMGSHEALLARNGLYRTLHDAQTLAG